jgi:hypothetical protein
MTVRYLIMLHLLCTMAIPASADPLCERLYSSSRYCDEQDGALIDRKLMGIRPSSPALCLARGPLP